MKLSNLEKETIITFNAAENHAEIYTCEPKWINKMDKLCEQHPQSFKLYKQDEFSKTYLAASKNAISIKVPRLNYTVLMEPQKVGLLKRFKGAAV
jgi:hypothetical protein